MNLDVTRITVDVTELLKVGLNLLQEPHHILHSMLHFTELYQRTPQLRLQSPQSTSDRDTGL